jgi:AraC-like DNA-binding protein
LSGPTIGAAFAGALFQLAVERGASRLALAERTGLDPLDLADPDARLSFDDYVRLMRVAKELTGDPALALHFGETVDPANLSIVASLGGNGGSSQEALDELNRFSPLAIDVDIAGGKRMEAVRQGGKLWLVDRRSNPNAFPELTESSFARMVCGARRLGLDFIRAVHFTHRAPPYRDEYERIFDIPIAFEREWNALQVDESAMSIRLGSQPTYVHSVLVEKADRLLAQLKATATLRGRVESLLLPRLSRGGRRAADIAADLGMSRQTLHRRLRIEGVTFERVLDDLRHRLAVRYLEEESATIDRIAERLGFADRVSFSKAFKRWTGHSPRARVR